MEVARRRGRRRKKLLDNLKDRRGYSHLKEEALDRTVWRHRFGGGFGPVVRQNSEWMNESLPLTIHECTVSTCCGQYPAEERNTSKRPLALYFCVQLVFSVQISCMWRGRKKSLYLYIECVFRFVWPCIINVGEERANRWHKHRCLFTIG